MLYAPLWGATLDTENVIVLSQELGLCLYKPEPEEWHYVEKHDVWIERLGAGAPPSPCLVVMRERDGDELARSGYERLGTEMIAAMSQGVSALRLAAPGWFLDPAIVSLTFAVPGGSWDIIRLPGPYRQVMLGMTMAPMPGYIHETSDTGDGDDWGPPALLELMSSTLAASNSALTIALASFNRSYGYALPARDRAAELFTAIDAMLVGMSAQRVGRVKLRRFGFRRRVEHALAFAGEPAEAAAREAYWLDSQDGGRGYRNALAHGRTTHRGPDVDDILRLQAIVRRLLRALLLFEASRLDEPDLAEQLGLAPAAGSILLFNRWLERRDASRA